MAQLRRIDFGMDRSLGRREERSRCALICDHIGISMRPEGVSEESVAVFRAGVQLVKQFILDDGFTPDVFPPSSNQLS